jgi:hypothetical protein
MWNNDKTNLKSQFCAPNGGCNYVDDPDGTSVLYNAGSGWCCYDYCNGSPAGSTASDRAAPSHEIDEQVASTEGLDSAEGEGSISLAVVYGVSAVALVLLVLVAIVACRWLGLRGKRTGTDEEAHSQIYIDTALRDREEAFAVSDSMCNV